MRIAKKAKFTRQTYACGTSWAPETMLTNLHEDLEHHRGLCATLPDGQLVIGILADDIEIVEEPDSPLSRSLVEEIAEISMLTEITTPAREKQDLIERAIQRRVEPLLGALESCLHELKNGPSDQFTRAAIIDVSETALSQLKDAR